MPSSHQETITLTVKAGTRDLLKAIREQTGLSKENVLSLGIRYIALKQVHDIKKRAGLKGKIAGVINGFRRNITPTQDDL